MIFAAAAAGQRIQFHRSNILNRSQSHIVRARSFSQQWIAIAKETNCNFVDAQDIIPNRLLNIAWAKMASRVRDFAV